MKLHMSIGSFWAVVKREQRNGSLPTPSVGRSCGERANHENPASSGRRIVIAHAPRDVVIASPLQGRTSVAFARKKSEKPTTHAGAISCPPRASGRTLEFVRPHVDGARPGCDPSRSRAAVEPSLIGALRLGSKLV
jgi:hypothetical protein